MWRVNVMCLIYSLGAELTTNSIIRKRYDCQFITENVSNEKLRKNIST